MRRKSELDFLYEDQPEFCDDLEYERESRNWKPLLFLLISTLFGGFVLNTTLASNININSGGVQFGQGLTQAIACAETATVIPIAGFKNPATSNRTNSILYAWTGDGIQSGGVGFSGLGYSAMDGVAGIANYVTIRVAPHSGNQISGVADPGNTASTYGSVVTVSGAGSTINQADSGVINAPGTQVLYGGGHSASIIRILTPNAGTITVNLYKEIGTGLFSTSISESVVITVKATATGNFATSESWQFSSVKVSGLNSRCFGKEFTINAFGTSSSTALDTYVYNVTNPLPFDLGKAARIVFDSNSASVSSGYSGYSVTRLSSTSFKVDFVTPSASSKDVYKVTVESGEPQ